MSMKNKGWRACLDTSAVTFVIRPSEESVTNQYGALEGWGRGQEAALDRKDSVWQTQLVEVVTEPPVQEGDAAPDSAHSCTPVRLRALGTSWFSENDGEMFFSFSVPCSWSAELRSHSGCSLLGPGTKQRQQEVSPC